MARHFRITINISYDEASIEDDGIFLEELNEAVEQGIVEEAFVDLPRAIVEDINFNIEETTDG